MAESVKEGVAEERKYTRNETQAEGKENTQSKSRAGGKLILYFNLICAPPPQPPTTTTHPRSTHPETLYLLTIIYI